MPEFPNLSHKQVVVFTDLDGTLLDHHTYAAHAATQAIEQLQHRGWPLIFCSSKTFSEQVILQEKLRVVAPFIFENGSAVAVPFAYFYNMPEGFIAHNGYAVYPLAHADFAAARAVLAPFEEIQGFSDASDSAMSLATGLSGEALSHARDRWFTETLLTPLNQAQAELISKEIAKKGWLLSKGGRFYTLLSAQADKGKAMLWLAGLFAANLPEPPFLVAFGDSLNDKPMLAAADLAFLVQRPDGSWSDMQIPGLNLVEGVGPEGFSRTVLRLMET